MRSKRTVFVLVAALAALHLTILLAGFAAPYDPVVQNRELSYAPPTHIHFVDSSGFHLRPFIYGSISELDSYREDLNHRYPVRMVVRGDGYTVFGVFKSNLHLFGVDQPARLLLFGSDGYGRDVFSRLLFGGQLSLAAGLLATFITLATATVIGTTSGYYGKWVDESLMGS